MSAIQEVGIDCPTGDVKVFFINKSNSLMGYDDKTIELYANKYNSKEDMMQDATDKIIALVDGGVVNPYIYSINAGFKTNLVLTKGVVSSELWNLMRMDKRQIGVLEAYIASYNITDIGEAEVTLGDAEIAYIGEYKDNTHFITSYLEDSLGLEDSVIEVLIQHINIDNLADVLTADHRIHGDYHFSAGE